MIRGEEEEERDAVRATEPLEWRCIVVGVSPSPDN